MIIRKSYERVGKERRIIYDLCNTAEEVGGREPRLLASFDSLESAALALRYIQGWHLSESDEMRAIRALKEAAAATNHSTEQLPESK